MQNASNILRSAPRILRNQPKRMGSHHKSFKELDMINKSTMDHLPKPQGSWQAGYSAKNMKATIFLAASTAAFALTVMEMSRQGCFDLLTDPAHWTDKQVERQAKYYARGERWRRSGYEGDEIDLDNEAEH